MVKLDPNIQMMFDKLQAAIDLAKLGHRMQLDINTRLNEQIDDFAAWLYQLAHLDIDQTNPEQLLVSDVYGNVLDYFEDAMREEVNIDRLLTANPKRKIPDADKRIYYYRLRTKGR